MADVAQRVGRLEVEMDQVQRGVSNFREFQMETRDFISWFRGREEERDKTDKARAKIHYLWLSLLSALMVATFGWLLTWASHVHHISENYSSPAVTQGVESHQPQQDASGGDYVGR